MKHQNVDLPWKGSETRDYKPYSTKISLMKKQRNSLLKKKRKTKHIILMGNRKKKLSHLKVIKTLMCLFKS